MEIIDESVLYEQSWTLLKEKIYRDNHGQKKHWSYIERRDRQRAVVVVARTDTSNSVILIKQFRIPLAASIYEFPAGLVDDGEEPAVTAVRELREETGYNGRVVEISPEISTSAGLTTETILMAFVRVDEEPAAAPAHEASENITVLKLPPRNFGSFLAGCAQQGRILDAKLYIYLNDRIGRRSVTRL